MSEAPAPTPALSLGARLTAAREAAGLSLPEAAERMHLDAATLQGIEREQYQALGAAVYVRGHLRRYAEMLGLPIAEIETAYGLTSSAVSAMPDLRRVATPLEAAGTPSWALRPGPAAAVAVLLVLAALVWWAVRMPHPARPTAPVNAAPSASESATAVPAAPAAEPGAAPSDGDAAPPAAEPAGAPAGSTGAPSRSPEGQHSVAATPSGAAAANVVALASPRPVPAQRAVAAATATPAGASAPGNVRLALQFRENSWVEIYDAGGARLMYELAPAGAQRALHGNAPLRILLGNPGGVDLAVDGRAVTFDEPSHGDLPLRLSLDGSGRVLEVRAAVTAGAATAPAGARP